MRKLPFRTPGSKPAKGEFLLPPLRRRTKRDKAALLVSDHSHIEARRKSARESSRGGRSNGGQAPQKIARPVQADAALGNGSDCRSILERCRRNAAKAAATEDDANSSVEAALAGIVRLKRLISSNPAAQEDLLKAYAEAGIKITKRTANEYTPLVKLVFPKKVHKAATVSRYASVLQFAEEENVRPGDFADFVRQNGGLAACAARASEKRRNAAGGSRQGGTAAAEALEARRRNAPTLQLPTGIPRSKEGPILLLVEPGPKGAWLILGYRRAPAGAVVSSSPVKAGPSGPTDGKRRG